MARGKCRKLSIRNQDYLASSVPRSPNKENTGYPNTPEKKDLVFKIKFLIMMEDFKKVIKNTHRKMQDNTSKQIEALRDETQKSLKELQENTNEQVKELKMEVETIKKAQRDSLDIENKRKRQGAIYTSNTSITNRIQDIEERISEAQDIIRKHRHNCQR